MQDHVPEVMREPRLDPTARLERVLELQRLLGKVARDIGPALELEPVLRTALAGIRSLVDFRGGTIGLVTEGSIQLAAADPPDLVSPEVMAARLPVGTGLSGRVVATAKAVYSPDVQADPRVDQALGSLGSNAAIRSYLAVPLVCLGSVIGVMQIYSYEPDAFDAGDLQVLEGLATLVAGSIESARHNESVRQLERLKTDFLARVSHELSTPLTIISGFANTLSVYGDEVGETERKHMLQRIEHAAQRLSALIDELLTVTQFEAGVILPQAANASLTDVLTTVREHCLKPESVAIDVPAGLQARTDARLLRHALGLLVDNALKYAGDCELRARAGDRSAGAVIEVIDHGPGIPADQREAVFERFMRGDSNQPGMGLGLSLVRTLISGISADIHLDETDGGGARFTITLPR